MLWLKRNLIMVISALVAVGLLVGAGTYLATEYNAFEAEDAAVKQRHEGITILKGYDPAPTEENILTLKNNASFLKKFMGDAEGTFLSVTNQKLDSPRFMVLIDNTIAELTKEATNAGVALPARGYGFTFGALRGDPSVVGYMIDPFVTQIEEVKSICSILYKAKVTALLSLQRVPVPNEKPGSAVDFLTDRSVVTNNYGIVVPYRVAFRCFTPELSAVLAGFAGAPQFMVVRTVNVQPADGSGGLAEAGPPIGSVPATTLPGQPPPVNMPVPGTMLPGGRPTPAPRPGAVQTNAPKSNLVKILDEKALQVTLDVDIIKPYKGPKLAPAPAGGDPAGTPPSGKKKRTPPAAAQPPAQ